ncbi:hypothetical protein BK716_29370 [Bacillus thuringiensis serovar higo]|uniref:Uncharacterized protein n=1 Tax=Bacillus thuringiensis subsp. higo TaxID=132266 RepID=A0A9X6LC39_BACUH|nr:hypothetical protein BK716_29370 [Bacillus thuringiensis serovar higo]
MLKTQNPLVVFKRYPFEPANRRGSPLKNEGVGGVFVWGLGKISPVGLGNAQGVFFCHVVTRLCRQGPRRALYIFDA